MPPLPDQGPSRARSALLFGLRYAAACLGLIVLIQLIGRLTLELFMPGASHPDNGATVFFAGLRVLLVFFAFAVVVAAWRWASLAGRRRVARWFRRHRWQVLTPLAFFAVIGFSASALQPPLAPALSSIKRLRPECVGSDAKQAARVIEPPTLGRLKDPPGTVVAAAAAPCPGPR